MFMGSVWMCARCSVEFERDVIVKTKIQEQEYVRFTVIGMVAGETVMVEKTGLVVWIPRPDWDNPAMEIHASDPDGRNNRSYWRSMADVTPV